jgi:nicotinamide mononucleotide (NMN) deamidase PncC
MVRAIASSDVGIGVTGYTTGDTKAPEDGFFYYAISYRDTLLVDKDQVEGTRDEMRFDQTTIILWRLLNLLRS